MATLSMSGYLRAPSLISLGNIAQIAAQLAGPLDPRINDAVFDHLLPAENKQG